MERTKKRFPNRLRKHREMFGYTQRQVAVLLGIKATMQLTMWEKGSTMPTAENLLKLSIIYRTLPNSLYHEHMTELKRDLANKEEALLLRLDK